MHPFFNALEFYSLTIYQKFELIPNKNLIQDQTNQAIIIIKVKKNKKNKKKTTTINNYELKLSPLISKKMPNIYIQFRYIVSFINLSLFYINIISCIYGNLLNFKNNYELKLCQFISFPFQINIKSR